MTFLFRLAFWLSLVILLLPSTIPRPDAPARFGGSHRLASVSFSTDPPQACPWRLDACCDHLPLAKLCRELHGFVIARMPSPAGASASEQSNRGQHTLTSEDLAAPWRGSARRSDAGVPAVTR